jgi:hypothetical protein
MNQRSPQELAVLVGPKFTGNQPSHFREGTVNRIQHLSVIP